VGLDRGMQLGAGMKHPANATDVSRMLGEVDPLIVERILAIGASADEIDEALRTVEEERGFGEQPHEPSSPAVVEVRAVLQETAALDGDAIDDELDSGVAVGPENEAEEDMM
jgi:hypothetical protein